MSDKTKYLKTYKELREINVNEHVEKKNGLNYLSWASAVDYLLKEDPMAYWSYGEPTKWGETVMMTCTVNAFGVSRTAQLPVMDYKNKAIPNPDAFSVNTCMQRVLAKAIGLHGIGLYIYQGEDLPQEDGESQETTERPKESSYKSKETPSNKQAHETKGYVLKTDEKSSVESTECGLVAIHFGKNRGIALKDLPEKSLRWYMETWAVETDAKPNASEADKKLVSALEEYARQITTSTDTEEKLPMNWEEEPDKPF